MKDVHQLIATIVDRLLHRREAGYSSAFRDDHRVHPGVRSALDRLEDNERLEQDLADYGAFKRDNAYRRTKAFAHIQRHIGRTRSGRIRAVAYYAAAAVLLLGLSVAFLLDFGVGNRPQDRPELLTLAKARSIVPGSTRATLTVDGLHTISLDSSAGSLVMNGQVVYENGRLVDERLATAKNVERLTVATPRGGEYVLQLADGSKVHLNAESSLTYPVTFPDSVRTVYLAGEAYFEVAQESGRPFRVVTEKNQINVLGTQFNVKAYPGETASYVTLVSGAVKVTGGDHRPLYLKPGLQSVSTATETAVRAVDIADHIAWKSGEFSFADVDLATAMATLARWYDYEVALGAAARDVRIWGTVSRYDTFDKVLEIIELVDRDLNITIEGRRITMAK